MDTMPLLPADRRFLTDAIRLAEEHLSEHEFNVTVFCYYLGKSRVTAYRRFRKILDKSTGDFIRDLRLRRAARLLEEGSSSIREVAHLSGFYNHSYFSKCFRRQFGLSPSDYIRNLAASSEITPE
jgi:transcriptional regulator GlxA family with amidase domain